MASDSESRNALDMKEARRKSSVDCTALHAYLHGMRDWDMRRRIVGVLSADPVFDKSCRSFLTRTQAYERALEMTRRVHELQDIHHWTQEELGMAIRVLDEPLPLQLHVTAFEPVLNSQGSEELKAQFKEVVARRGIHGAYLQTELGHGTNVASLETTATYLPDTREFDIHSPTLTSTKWWIGALGRTATHGVVQARLILPSGLDAGPHLFLIQLRSLEDHAVLPGITVGDIGPKAMGGYNTVDNGYARFDHVRVPRENMLSAFASVTPDGKYVKPPHAKLSYGGMLYIRSGMVASAGWTIAKGITIALRYATVRRQGSKAANGLERQVITYPSVYIRLLPALAHAYVFIQLGKSLTNAFTQLLAQLSSGNTSLLAEMHATLSGLKVLVSTTAIQDLETARRSMGGHGFSDFAGVGRLYADYVPAATYEGDNFVLDQQVVRAALKAFDVVVVKKTVSSSSLTPSTAYLRRLSTSAPVAQDWDDPSTAVAFLEHRAALMVQERAAWAADPDASMDARVARAVSDAFVAARVGELIQALDGPNAGVLRKLFQLHLLTTVEAGLVDMLSFGLLGEGKPGTDVTRGLRVGIKRTCEELLPEAIGLSDGFGFTDWELDSALGAFDGNAYENLWKRAQAEPLNRGDAADAYERHMKPLLQRGQRLSGYRSKL
ncbi:acyl-CoA oxidase [Epithele typhae]|uniref:acyl-CoA oxidase n=1 Tax=Epithele typhae TaxID=378194 RepID=UPI0020089776|nr:acyl-CoA oxidase [Epithele typhae]KAH9914088.1 acyl-CoA oxidase [Epithele typhae]